MSDVPEEVTQWCRVFATAAGTDPPTDQEIDDLLALAAIAAHASARQAAPITCWLAARGGMTLEAALAAANSISDS
jgi:nitroreductase